MSEQPFVMLYLSQHDNFQTIQNIDAAIIQSLMAPVRLAATDDDGGAPVRTWLAEDHHQSTIIASGEFLFLHQRGVDELALFPALALPDVNPCPPLPAYGFRIMEHLLAQGFGVPMNIADKFLEFAAIRVELRIRREARLAKHLTDPEDREVSVFPEDLVDGGNQLHVEQ